jgi:hypothetical protein
VRVDTRQLPPQHFRLCVHRGNLFRTFDSETVPAIHVCHAERFRQSRIEPRQDAPASQAPGLARQRVDRLLRASRREVTRAKADALRAIERLTSERRE